MKIDRVTTVGTTPSRRSERGSVSRSNGFSKALASAQPAAPASISGGASVAPVDALLALQEIGNEPNRRALARRRGDDLLDRLEELRLGLLDGRLPVAVIERLAAVVAVQRSQIDDPRLIGILDDIELRAAVELAKLGR